MTAISEQDRRVPAWGGFNLTFVGLEIRRILRNRRTMIFVLVMPTVLFLVIGLSQKNESLDGVDALPYFMISMAVYGAMVATTATGAAVAVERALGWSRQLRLTPLVPSAYMATKVISALSLGLLAVLVVYVAGFASGVRMSVSTWVISGLVAWLGSLVFAAFGLFMGFLLPSENVMQFVGPLLALLALFGGIFVPIEIYSDVLQDIAKLTPVWGIGALARAPLTGDGASIGALANALVWLAIFGVGAAQLFRRDTKRV